METIFGVHHDTASLREKNQKIESQEHLGLTNKNSVENTIQTKQSHQEPNSSEKLGSIQSIFRDRFSISPATSPHTTPPTSRPSTPLSFDAQKSSDNLSFSDQINSGSQTIMTASPLARTAYYHHDPKIFQNVKKVLPSVGDIEGNIINRPPSPWSLYTKSGDEFVNRNEKNLFKKN
ncbi:hypothetical protein C1645_567265 [Glomus cerebriforme]|uniref:Uncharacterized protein n=1 Tax=Glomus cerebriforme TaxID=658196 RepID=A0A397T7X7_9GLOM|nr:hypothetical protein C1645_567265 [Glomus cerebriforme]